MMGDPGSAEVDLKTLVELCDDIKIEVSANVETNELFVDFYGKPREPLTFVYVEIPRKP